MHCNVAGPAGLQPANLQLQTCKCKPATCNCNPATWEPPGPIITSRNPLPGSPLPGHGFRKTRAEPPHTCMCFPQTRQALSLLRRCGCLGRQSLLLHAVVWASMCALALDAMEHGRTAMQARMSGRNGGGQRSGPRPPPPASGSCCGTQSRWRCAWRCAWLWCSSGSLTLTLAQLARWAAWQTSTWITRSSATTPANYRPPARRLDWHRRGLAGPTGSRAGIAGQRVAGLAGTRTATAGAADADAFAALLQAVGGYPAGGLSLS
eukprot:357849-Chlamydomonas_euryale.AAC.2